MILKLKIIFHFFFITIIIKMAESGCLHNEKFNTQMVIGIIICLIGGYFITSGKDKIDKKSKSNTEKKE